jgi:hypothetical protein
MCCEEQQLCEAKRYMALVFFINPGALSLGSDPTEISGFR